MKAFPIEFHILDDENENRLVAKVKYVADFKYIQNDKTIVEDVKSDFTSKDKTYRVKIKWFLSIYGKEINFKEI